MFDLEEFKRIHYKDRVYEVELSDTDIYRERREFEIADTFKVLMKCVGIDRKRSVAKYKRDTWFYFGDDKV